MTRGLLAPLSPHELTDLLKLVHRSDFEPDHRTCHYLITLGLITKTDEGKGFEITELGKERLEIERKT